MARAMVWASNAMINPAMLRPITHCFNNDAQLDFALKSRRKNDNGEVLNPECFPAEIFVARHAKTNYENLPELFFAGSYWIVSGEVALVMQQFDLGNANLYPTQVFRKDRKTPIGVTWFCLNFGNVKVAYLGGGWNMNPSIPEPPVRHSAPMTLRDDGITLSVDALAGPEIWVDPQIGNLFFVSDRLAKALKDAGVARAFGFKKCKVV